MKLTINKFFQGHSSCSKQMAVWIDIEVQKDFKLNKNLEIDTDDILINLSKMWSLIHKESKIVVSDEFEILEKNESLDIITYQICLSYYNEEACRVCLESLSDIFNTSVSLNEIIESTKQTLFKFSQPGQNQVYFLEYCNLQGIPFRELTYGLHQFSTGKFSKKLSSTSSDQTSVIGVNLSKNKIKTSVLLKNHGLPHTNPISVFSLEHAKEIAKLIGYPVVVKPLDRDRGEGVYADIQDENTLEMFYKKSVEYSQNIILEKHFHGTGHRFTFFKDKVIAVTKKLPKSITGDGLTSIINLLDHYDDEVISMIEQRGYTLEGVLKKGEVMPIKRKNNASAGGVTIPLDLNSVNKDNIDLCFAVSKLFGLDFVGVDLIIPNISKSWLEQDCVICDVNSVPQIGQDRVEPIFQKIFESGTRIDVYLLIVNSPLNYDLTLIKSITGINNYSTYNGVWINDSLVSNRYENGLQSAKSLIWDNNIDGAICVMTKDGVKSLGLPLDKFNCVYLKEVILDKDLEKILKGQTLVNL